MRPPSVHVSTPANDALHYCRVLVSQVLPTFLSPLLGGCAHFVIPRLPAVYDALCVPKFWNFTVPVAVFTISTQLKGVQSTGKGDMGSHNGPSWSAMHA